MAFITSLGEVIYSLRSISFMHEVSERMKVVVISIICFICVFLLVDKGII